jgi:hypothetical protein
MAKEIRRRISRSRCFARIIAAPINCRSPAALSTANGAIMNPAARSRRPWSAGGCGAPDGGRRDALCHYATEIATILRSGTGAERTAPESVVLVAAGPFTARYRAGPPGAAPYPARRHPAVAAARLQRLIAVTRYFHGVTGGRCLLVQIPDRLSFGTQRTNVLPCNDLISQAVNFVTLRRRPTAEILHAFQQA